MHDIPKVRPFVEAIRIIDSGFWIISGFFTLKCGIKLETDSNIMFCSPFAERTIINQLRLII